MYENAQDIGVQEKDIDDKMIDDIFSKPIQKEEMSNPTESQTEKSPPLEPSSTSKIQSDGVTKSSEKKSVRKELQKYREEEKIETEKKNANKNKTDIGKTNISQEISIKTTETPKLKEKGK